MGDVTLKIDADVAQYIAKMARGSEATKKVAKDAGSIGDEFVKGVTKLETFKKAIEAAGRAVTSVLDKSAEASKRGGARALSLATSLGALGVRDITGASTQLSTAQGASSVDERVAFAQALENANRSRRVPLSESTVNQALDAYTRGGDLQFGRGGNELIEGLGKGLSVTEIARRSALRRPGLQGVINNPNGPVMTELALQTVEDQGRVTEEAARRTAGLQVRAGRVANDVTAATKGGIADTFRGILPDAANGALDAARGRSALDDVRDLLETQNSIMTRSLNRPNFNTTVGGQ